MQGPDGTLPEAIGRKVEPLMSKDLAAARELGDTLGVATPLVEVIRTRARDTLDLADESSSPTAGPEGDALHQRGLQMMDQVYGPGFSKAVDGFSDPFTDQTIDYLFAQVWSREGLSVRDRRLLTLGVAATVGQSQLIQIIANGASSMAS